MLKKLVITDLANVIKDKRLLVRVDFNVPMKDGRITDETRIKSSLKTINYLKEQGAKSVARDLKEIYQVSIIDKNKGFYIIKCKSKTIY